jgi:hypothetical protein
MGLLAAVVAPLAGIGLMFASTMFYAYGPSWLDNWVGTLLQLALWMACMGLVVFTNVYFEQVVVFFGSFLALGFAVFAAQSAADALVLHQRGLTTSCRIVHIDKREETHTTTDANGGTRTTTDTYYDHGLICLRPRITAMTTGSPAGKVGERITVAYDPDGRIATQPAEGAFDYTTPLWVCVVGTVVGIGLRLSYLVFRR